MTNSIMLNPEESSKLIAYIKGNKLKTIPVKSRYESMRIDHSGLKLILYKSGKLVYNTDDRAMIIVDSILDEHQDKYCYTLGSDEAGKGEWYGPLVVYCVALQPEHINKLRLLGVRDSKNIPKRKLIKLTDKILKINFQSDSIVLMPDVYNRKYKELNSEGKTLNDLLAWAHARLIKNILGSLDYSQVKVIIDKFDLKKTEYRLGNLDKKGVEIIQKTRAESEIPVATASILAKMEFEKRVDQLDNEFKVNLRKTKPANIAKEILPNVAKTHFKNVPQIY